MASSSDENILEKRAELLDKLAFLYERAITDYVDAKGQTKNSFLNTALAIMSKIVDIEGVKSPEKLEANLNTQSKMTNLAGQLNTLNPNEKQSIITAVRTVIEQRKQSGSGESPLPNGASRVRTPSLDDAGILGES
jgi:hypothetical protein